MSAGPLRHLVTLEQRSQAADSSVGITISYASVAQVWAKIEGVKGALYVAAVQVVEAPTHRIVIRHRAMTDFDHIAEVAPEPETSTVAEDFDYTAGTFLAALPDGLLEDFDYLAGTYAAPAVRRWRVRDIRDPDGMRKWVEIMAEELKDEAA